jgi:hypothetical protein
MTDASSLISDTGYALSRLNKKKIPVVLDWGYECWSEERLAQISLWLSSYYPEFELSDTFDERMRFNLVLTPDYVVAARAYVFSRSLSGIAPDHQWLGAFEDGAGRYFAYLRRQTADLCTNGNLWDMQEAELPVSAAVKAFDTWLTCRHARLTTSYSPPKCSQRNQSS